MAEARVLAVEANLRTDQIVHEEQVRPAPARARGEERRAAGVDEEHRRRVRGEDAQPATPEEAAVRERAGRVKLVEQVARDEESAAGRSAGRSAAALTNFGLQSVGKFSREFCFEGTYFKIDVAGTVYGVGPLLLRGARIFLLATTLRHN